MADIVNAAIAGASAGAFLGLGWIGVASFALLNSALAARRAAGMQVVQEPHKSAGGAGAASGVGVQHG